MKDHYKIWSTTLLILLWLVPGMAFGQTEVELTQVWELADSLDRPESALYDTDRRIIYVTNIGGDPTEKDDNGYISTVSPEGQLVEAKWATGLHAPKGMALSGDTLYTADIDALVAIDPETGEILERYPGEGASFLNDVTADEAGRVYVSDSQTGALYRLSGGSFEVWQEDVPSPNGVWAEDDRLVVAAGPADAEDPGSERYLQVTSFDGGALEPLGDETPLGGLDAVVPDEQGGYFLSDWGGAVVMHYHPERGATTLAELTQGTADLDYAASEGLIFLPVMMSDRLVAFQVEGL